MKKLLVAAVLLLSALTLKAQENPKEKDWAQFGRYAQYNVLTKDRPVAVLFGDSITRGWEKMDYPWLHARRFYGRGISGQVTSQMLVRFRQDVIDMEPQYVVILAGINDIAHNNGRIKVEHIFHNLQSMVELAQVHGIKPVMCTLCPTKEIFWYKEMGDPRPAVDSLNTLIRQYAAANQIPLADYHSAMKDEENGLKEAYAKDPVHPNMEGYKVMEAVLLETLGKAEAQVSDEKPILTPKAPKTPKVNGAKVVGAHPGAPFLYRIAATGERPMQFAAEGLPKGLKLDSQTGIITGKVKKAGTYKVTLKATNGLGSAERELRIVIGDKIALTPPLGWNSWNVWGNSVTQEQVLASAKAMVESGLADCGWTYINIDDGWQGVRGGKWNAIQPNKKFPDMKGLSDKIHSMGLKFGIYSGPWVTTYAGHIGSSADHPDGSYNFIRDGLCDDVYKLDRTKVNRKEYRYFGQSFVEADVKQWAAWGVDYLKYDWYPNDEAHTREMADAIAGSGRDIILSLSNKSPWADAKVWEDCAQAWRTTDDIRDSWASMSTIGFDGQDRWAPYCGPGHWPDADMLVVGRVGWGPNVKDSRLTADEQYTHISLWALLANPLLIGCDMANLDEFTLNLLSNTEVLDVNQDPLGVQATRLNADPTAIVYVKPLEDGSLAVGLFNRGEKPARVGFGMRGLGLFQPVTVRDLWRQQDLGTILPETTWDTLVAPHGVVLVKLTKN